jgi:hypothetical protein
MSSGRSPRACILEDGSNINNLARATDVSAPHPKDVGITLQKIRPSLARKNKFQSGYSLRDALELVDALSFQSQEQKHELSHLYEAKLRNTPLVTPRAA